MWWVTDFDVVAIEEIERGEEEMLAVVPVDVGVFEQLGVEGHYALEHQHALASVVVDQEAATMNE